MRTYSLLAAVLLCGCAAPQKCDVTTTPEGAAIAIVRREGGAGEFLGRSPVTVESEATPFVLQVWDRGYEPRVVSVSRSSRTLHLDLQRDAQADIVEERESLDPDVFREIESLFGYYGAVSQCSVQTIKLTNDRAERVIASLPEGAALRERLETIVDAARRVSELKSAHPELFLLSCALALEAEGQARRTYAALTQPMR